MRAKAFAITKKPLFGNPVILRHLNKQASVYGYKDKAQFLDDQEKRALSARLRGAERKLVVLFKDRSEAGRALARRLQTEGYGSSAVVLALPRGGVPVAFEVARALGASLDVFIVRKLGTPGQEELALGALASGGARVMNDDLISRLGISADSIERVVERESAELTRREKLYRGGRPLPRLENRTVILIDDGLATGASMRAAVKALKRLEPAKLVVAVPVAAAETCAALALEAADILCLETPTPFYGVGRWYEQFPQTSDEEVQTLLQEAAARA